ncbi:hypothetical protein QUC31_013893 [Theobroma cacao]
MALEIIIAMLFFLSLRHWCRNSNSHITNWPIVRMMAALLCNPGRIFEFFTPLFNLCGGTFKFEGFWFPSLDFVLISNPVNIYHILCRNFDNYEKGSEFREIFEPFGEVKQGSQVDPEDVLQRFDCDHICLLALGFDPKSPSTEFPKVSSKVAFAEVEEALLHRNILPVSIWRCISLKREKLRCKTKVEDNDFDLLTAFMVEEEGEMSRLGKSDKFLRDTAYSFITAGKDNISTGLSWFFWLIATHPYVESKILEEIKVHSPARKDRNLMPFTGEEMNKFACPHAALCETLRLYPPLPVTSRIAIKSEAEIVLMREQGSLFLSIQWEGRKKYGVKTVQNSSRKGGHRSVEISYLYHLTSSYHLVQGQEFV